MDKNVFQFRDHSITVNLAGHDFSFELGGDFSSKCDKWSEEFFALSKKTEGKEMSGAELTGKCSEALDDLLGDGAFKKIFEGREPSALDVFDILIFLTDRASDYKKSQMNRAQRRANGKKKS